MRQQMIFRVRLIAAFLVLMAFGIIIRLYFVQIVYGEVYLDRASRQYVHSVKDLYSRGSILFTTKDNLTISAASIRHGFILIFNPKLITDPQRVCTQVAAVLASTTPYEHCLEKATMTERTYVEIDTQVSSSSAAMLREYNEPGVQLARNQWRYYPGGSLAARTLGFIGYTEKSATELHGKYGLERFYDTVLYRSREVKTINLFAQLFGNLGENGQAVDQGQSPGDIVVTLEPTVSNRLDAILAATNDKYKSDLTGAIIMNPKTGEIYAMSAVPMFDLNNRAGATVADFQNPLVENVYEFGSTIKALTMAAGLDSRAVTRTSTYYDTGCIELNTKKICNFDGQARGTVDMQQVLSQSLNTGVSYIVTKMGRNKFRDYFINFKLGSESGIDLPSEAKGLTNFESPRDVEYATASFGQGIAVSPIAAARALAALGNGGYMVTPHLVSEIRQTDGTVKKIQYPQGAQVLRSETSEEISRILVEVVDKALLHGTVSQERHTIAAKTGTAQMADAKTGKYSETDYLHSFFGYFPAYDPQFLVFMYTVKPQGVRFASETLTLPFMEIAKFLINYYSIPPDR